MPPAAGTGARPSPPERPLELSRAWYAGLLTATLGAALAAQLFLLLQEKLYSVSLDESERTLIAGGLTFTKAFTPTFWPPLPQDVFALALKLDGNLFATPRVVVALVGLLTVAATALLARELFDSRAVALVAALLAAFVPQRLLLSVAPLADVFAYLFLLLAATWLARWLRDERRSTLVVASLWLLLAGAVRYEDWGFNAVLACYLAYRTFARGDLDRGTFVTATAVLAAFPVAWVAGSYAHDGSLSAFSLTSRQFVETYGHAWHLALGNDAAVLFVRDALLLPAVLAGSVALVVLAVRRPLIRTWAVLLFAPLALLSLTMAVSLSVPTAANFRIDGAWLLLVVPFAAWTIVTLTGRVRATPARSLAAAAMLLMCLVPAGIRTHARAVTARRQIGALGDSELNAAVDSVLDRTQAGILLDASDNLDYLNVLVRSNAPDRFVLNVDAPATLVSIYEPNSAYYNRKHDTRIVERYLADKFGLAHGLALRALRRRHIGYLLVHNPAYVAALAAGGRVQTQYSDARWTLFRLRASAG